MSVLSAFLEAIRKHTNVGSSVVGRAIPNAARADNLIISGSKVRQIGSP
jgi:hypothetical protein